ncbi:hypothetical protein L6164_032995 [Bauhinia variegata]|uniref:Uncharacterized protein n=1 Tax=Bauhinia variegata TaxID=167791 RepID=A0ACB9KR87_BAUVA|nr:hypothetical protein L6164_032995 [Bauhinia variegata]
MVWDGENLCQYLMSPKTVPDRYIRDYKDRPIIDKQSPDASEIPVIDFSLLSKRDKDEIKKLDFACTEWGFFQLVNHGVAEELIYKMKESGKGFFDLPYEEKKKYAMAENDLQGHGQGLVVSEEQKLDWSDRILLVAYPPEQRKLKFWPVSVPGFNPHSDGGTITLLVQDDDLAGLQIKHKGRWIPVKPIPGAFVVNLGDTMEFWSNGAYKSIEHRAVTNATKARISIAIFVMPDEQAEIGPVETMVRDQPVLYKRFKYIDYLRRYFDKELDGKNTGIVKLEGQ